MNFFGHATVASWSRDDPAYVLGAMLPDFATMVAGRFTALDDALVSDGVALHHRTDAVFHALPVFIGWCAGGARALTDAGVRRGPARAVAHIGSELLLDAWLAERFGVAPAYRRALAAASPGTLGAGIRWSSPDDPRRFDALRLRLLRFADRPPDDDPEELTFRLCRALDSRPRLAIAPNEVAAITRWLEGARRPVVRDAPSLVADLSRALEAAA